MDELSRTVIEQYCWSHNSKKSRRLAKLVDMSYDPGCMPTDSDALFLEKVIDDEEDPELLRALKDLDDYLFRW